MSHVTYVFDGAGAIRKFYEETADSMDCTDYDLDEIIAAYPQYLRDDTTADAFCYRPVKGSPLTERDGNALAACVRSLYTRLGYMFKHIRPAMSENLSTVEVVVKEAPDQRLKTIEVIVRIYNDHDKTNPRIVRPPEDH